MEAQIRDCFTQGQALFNQHNDAQKAEIAQLKKDLNLTTNSKNSLQKNYNDLKTKYDTDTQKLKDDLANTTKELTDKYEAKLAEQEKNLQKLIEDKKKEAASWQDKYNSKNAEALQYEKTLKIHNGIQQLAAREKQLNDELKKKEQTVKDLENKNDIDCAFKNEVVNSLLSEKDSVVQGKPDVSDLKEIEQRFNAVIKVYNLLPEIRKTPRF